MYRLECVFERQPSAEVRCSPLLFVVHYLNQCMHALGLVEVQLAAIKALGLAGQAYESD